MIKNFNIFRFLYPSNSFTHIPFSFTCFIVFSKVSIPMLFALIPLSNVYSSIWPYKLSNSLLQIISILSFINSSVRPFHNSLSKLIVHPLSFKFAAINPSKYSLTMYLTLKEITPIVWGIGKVNITFSMPLPIQITSFVGGSISKTFRTLSILHVVLPSALIQRCGSL